MDEQADEQITCQMCGAGGFNSKDELDAHNREAHGDEVPDGETTGDKE